MFLAVAYCYPKRWHRLLLGCSGLGPLQIPFLAIWYSRLPTFKESDPSQLGIVSANRLRVNVPAKKKKNQAPWFGKSVKLFSEFATGSSLGISLSSGVTGVALFAITVYS